MQTQRAILKIRAQAKECQTRFWISLSEFIFSRNQLAIIIPDGLNRDGLLDFITNFLDNLNILPYMDHDEFKEHSEFLSDYIHGQMDIHAVKITDAILESQELGINVSTYLDPDKCDINNGNLNIAILAERYQDISSQRAYG